MSHSNQPAIEVTNISKSYNINHQRKAYGTLKDDIGNFLKRPLSGNRNEEHEKFWALKDINFTVEKGEIFGVIGKNGSGKSTLLKILSRIVDPTTGSVKMRGRVASLLEVGTGFHPELTGRENIYFNGSMIGMSRQEIKKRFQEIVDFSEIEKFIDTPVKFYSSGMYVRLAFSVAAHLEPDILILDEVLAVGDASFQKKSLNKIISTMESGCTVLMVSHSAENMRKLCKRGILLNNGTIESMGKIDKVLFDYTGSVPQAVDPRSTLLKEVEQEYSRIKNDEELGTDAPFEVELCYNVKEPLPNGCRLEFLVDDSGGNYILHTSSDFQSTKPSFEVGKHTITLKLPRLSLNTGLYSTWFRFTAQKEFGEYVLDTDRQVFEVKGRKEKRISAVDLPFEWEIKEH